MNRFSKLLSASLAILSTFASGGASAWAATTVSVNADRPSGTYGAPFEVTLSASDPAAKIWYVFNPDSPPGDALPYSKPIRIEKSTPLLFFAYVDLQNESKIERRDYVVSLPTSLRFAQTSVEIPQNGKTVSVTVENFGDSPVPLTNWTLRTESETRTFGSEAATVQPGASATFELPYSEGAVTLSSPDSEIRSTASVTRLAEATETVAKPVAAAVRKPKPKPAQSPVPAPTATAPQTTGMEDGRPSSVADPLPNAGTPPENPDAKPIKTEVPAATTVTPPENPVSTPSQDAPENAAIKVSAIESGKTDSPLPKAVGIGFLAILAVTAGVRTFRKKYVQ